MRNTIKAITKNIWRKILFLFFLYQTAIVSLTTNRLIYNIVNYSDEFFTIIIIFYIFNNYKTLLRDKMDVKIFKKWILFLFLQVISTIIFRYQGLFPSIVDGIFIQSKFLLAYFAGRIYMKRNYSTKFFINIFGKITKINIIILFVLTIHDIFINPFFEKGDFRYFTNSIKLFFPHETYLAVSGIILLILLNICYKHSRKKIIYMIMISIVIIMTLRMKAIGFIAIFLGMYFWIFVLKKRQIWINIAGGIIVSIYLAIDQFKVYFFSGIYSPRQIMLKDSLILLKKHFPLGSGLGSYGTTIAAQYYSPIYEKFGYNNYYGMSADRTSFLTDSFWPAIIAQGGLIGLIIFILVIKDLFIITYKRYKINNIMGFSAMMIIIYSIITSFAESSFFNPMSFILYFIMGAIISQVDLEKY